MCVYFILKSVRELTNGDTLYVILFSENYYSKLSLRNFIANR